MLPLRIPAKETRPNRGGTSVNNPKSSDADEIRKFKKLLDDGIITKKEFEAKKTELLGITTPTNSTAKEEKEAKRIMQEEARKAAEAKIRLAKEQAQLVKEQRLAKEREEIQHRKEENKKRADETKERAKNMAQKAGKTAVKASKTGGIICLRILATVFFLVAAILAISKFAFQAIDGFTVVIAIIILVAIGVLLLKMSKILKQKQRK